MCLRVGRSEMPSDFDLVPDLLWGKVRLTEHRARELQTEVMSNIPSCAMHVTRGNL